MGRTKNAEIDALFEYGLDIASKTIYIGSGADDDVDVDHVLAANVIKALIILDRIRPESPITVIINCQGGDTQHGMAIYDTIRNCKSEVRGIVVGHAYSMAAWILQACDHRSMTKHSSMMIHGGEEAISGKSGDVRNWKAFYEMQDSLLEDLMFARIIEKNPDFKKTKLQKLLDTDTILWPQQAIDLGLCDSIQGEK